MGEIQYQHNLFTYKFKSENSSQRVKEVIQFIYDIFPDIDPKVEDTCDFVAFGIHLDKKILSIQVNG